MDKDALKGEIKRKGMTIAQAAENIGISESTMCRKLKTGEFTLPECEALIGLLDIREPWRVFFDGDAESTASDYSRPAGELCGVG